MSFILLSLSTPKATPSLSALPKSQVLSVLLKQGFSRQSRRLVHIESVNITVTGFLCKMHFGSVINCLTRCPTRFILGPGNRWLCYISSVPSSAPMSLINLGYFCASTSHGCSPRRARSAGMDIASSVATTLSGLSDTCAMNTMRTRLGFSLTMSSDGFHAGGRGVRRTRNEGKRDSSNARGVNLPWGEGRNNTRVSITTTSCCVFFDD